jgi:putative ABC transport system permease protein
MLTRSLLRAGLRDFLRRPLHTGLMVLGVALGVAVVIAIDLANGSARRAFDRSTQAVVGRATHQVLGGPSGLPEEWFARLRREGLRKSAPVVEGVAVGLDLDRQPLRVLGVDPLADRPFRELVGGGSIGTPGFGRFYTDPQAVLIGSGMAARYRLTPGSPLRVQVQDRFASLTILGVIETADAEEQRPLDGLVVMDVGAAQRLFGLVGRLSRIDLILEGDEAARVERLLPEGARLVPASEQAGAAAQLTAAFSLNLTALSLLALLVGMFLIYNTVLFGVVQRRAVFGTLRALGVTGGQVFALILVEAALTSALGALLGVGLGWVLGQGAVRLVTQTINDLYFVLSVRDAPLTLTSTLKGVGLGIGAALLAAAAPALEASRVEPVVALRPSTLEGRTRRLLPWVSLAGFLLAALGAAALLGWPRSLVMSFAGLFAIVLGLALVTPGLTVLFMAAAGPLAAVFVGTLGRLAARTVTRSVSRTGVAIASLMVAVSVTIGVSLMIQSFRGTVENWLGLSLRADIFIATTVPGGARARPVLSSDVPARVAAVAGVAALETFRGATVSSPFGDVQLAVADPRGVRSTALYRYAEGDDPNQVWKRVLDGAVVVSEPFAFRHAIPPHGGSVTLLTDRGVLTFPVAGVFYDYATERGLVMMSRTVYERYWDDRAISSLGVSVAPGQPVEEVADRLRTALAGTALQVTSNRSLRAQALKVFDRTFAVTESLRLLAVVVAFIGVWSALMALQVERTRELATLQALGLIGRQLWGLTLLETGFMGATAGILSLPTGFLLAAILVKVINVRSFGWTMRLHADPMVFVQALGVSIAAAVLASVYPILRLQRLPMAAALRHE